MRLRPSHNPHLITGLCWLTTVVVFAAGSLSAVAQPIILHLRNGDRLTGRLLSESTNELALATAFAERLTIPKELVESREMPPPPTDGPTKTNQLPQTATTSAPTNKPAALPIARPPSPASGIAGDLMLTNKPPAAQTAAATAATSSKEKPPEPSAFNKFLHEWRGEAQFGANVGFSTKDREAFTGHLKLTHNHAFANLRAIRNILDYDVAYGTTDDVISDDRMEGTWKAEYDLSKRLLIYGAAGAGYDEIRGIDFQYDLGPGLGYKWVVLTNFVFKNELGGDYQEQFFIQDNHTVRYSLRLAEDLWWQITPKIRFDEKVEFFPTIRDFADYRFRFEGNLSYLLKQNLTLSLNVIDLYDTAVPDGISKNDLQIRSLLGIKF